eukprot:g1467.t1
MRLLLLVLGPWDAVLGLPAWSWDTVSTYVHCANRTGSWNDEALAVMARQAFVVFEKNQGLFSIGQAPGYAPPDAGAEQKIVAACAQVKALSPTTDCYMYVESDWARTFFDLGHALDARPELELRAQGGWLVNTTSTETLPNGTQRRYVFHAYDFSQAEVRARWVARVTDALASGVVDGAFIDGNRGGWASAILGACAPEKRAAWSAGLNASHALLRARAPDATLISNYATSEALEYCSGGMIERFTPDQGGPQLQALAAAGRLADVHAQYATGGVAKHLAAFLLFMGEHSYFGAGGGWDGDGADACSTWLREWPEYSRPLGMPLGPARRLSGSASKGAWARDFAGRGGVPTRVYLNNSDHPAVDTSCIQWADGARSEVLGGCAEAPW